MNFKIIVESRPDEVHLPCSPRIKCVADPYDFLDIRKSVIDVQLGVFFSSAALICLRRLSYRGFAPPSSSMDFSAARPYIFISALILLVRQDMQLASFLSQI
jgi:hypothetical protein